MVYLIVSSYDSRIWDVPLNAIMLQPAIRLTGLAPAGASLPGHDGKELEGKTLPLGIMRITLQGGVRSAGELVYTARMVEARARGYFGMGVEGASKAANVGALLRTGHAFGASFCFVIGTGWDSRAARTADTADTPSHVPMWRYSTLAELSLPRGCALVGIELLEDAVDLPSFRHPLSAAYVLGPERAGLSAGLLGRCDHVVRIPTRFALNLAVAGALVMYDRLLQHGRFAERPVGSRGQVEKLEATGHGPPRFRKTIPDWLRADAKKP